MTGTDLTPYQPPGEQRALFQAAGGDYHGSDRRFRLQLSPGVLLVYLAVIATLIGVGWYAGTRSADEQRAAHADDVDTSGQVSDDFSRPAGSLPMLLQGSAGAGELTWASLGSGFEMTSAGTAQVMAAPPGETSMALTDPGFGDVTILSTVTNAPPTSGLVFRFQDVFNHWSLNAAPEFGTWNLVQVADGAIAYSKSVGLSSTEPGTTIAISLDGPSISVFVDGSPVLALVDRTFQQATTVGLVALNGSGAAFDEFTVVINDLPLSPAGNTGRTSDDD